ncbi:MAG: 2,4-dihydroxyhept-2-ene-1,7-dioic acid aldolase [Candidatus Omnitrophica bacterium]|nr:2,4-dihydroxyhept-2-ene-1,7-dioic acid aldolase [Candidatus Omnitrophota bacterium]
MKTKQTYLGSWLTRPDLGITEIMAKSGYFDWLTIDLEHSVISLSQMEDMVRIIQANNIDALVRLTENDPILIKRVLDAGVNGIIVPMVNSATDVKKAVNACFYPPKGVRGVGLARAQNYGLGFKEYKERKQNKIKIIIQIEHVKAVDNIEEIFAEKNIYGYFVGPYDLSASLGKAGEFEDKKVLESLERVKAAGIKYGIMSGYHVIEPDKDLIKRKKSEGYTIIGISLDMLFLHRGLGKAFD